ncbi:hypothetical protein AgCh_039198 [Apium graveolens]
MHIVDVENDIDGIDILLGFHISPSVSRIISASDESAIASTVKSFVVATVGVEAELQVNVERQYNDSRGTSMKISADPYAKVSRNDYDFSKNMNSKLVFTLLPLAEWYRRIFKDAGPRRDDIALYFYPSRVDM